MSKSFNTTIEIPNTVLLIWYQPHGIIIIRNHGYCHKHCFGDCIKQKLELSKTLEKYDAHYIIDIIIQYLPCMKITEIIKPHTSDGYRAYLHNL